MNRLLMFLSWLALPIYLWQGAGVRLRTHRLAPPKGPAQGEIEGTGEPLRLLIIGDSSAVGIGVGTTDKNLAGHLTPLLATRTGRPVNWRAAGSNSATSGQIRDFVVPNLERVPWTHIIVSVGTNDMKNLHTLARFKRDFGGLLYALKARFPTAEIYWPSMMDMRTVPALPRPLADIMEMRAKGFNRLATRLCAERGAIPLTRLVTSDGAGFSEDGFHAGEKGYRAWAEHIASQMTV